MNESRTAGRRQALLGLGSNLGDRAGTLGGALEALRTTAGIESVSPSRWFETEPVGFTDQPPFLNLVAGLETTLAPEALLAALQGIEARFGRVRDLRWGPRTLDLDLLAYEGETRHTPTLELPHPRLLERAFVIVPLREVLARPPFRTDAWAALQAELARQPAEFAGVRPIDPS